MFKKAKYDLNKFQNRNNSENLNDIFRSMDEDDISGATSNNFSNVDSNVKSKNKVKKMVDSLFHRDRIKDLEKELENARLRKEYAQRMLDKERVKSRYIPKNESFKNSLDRIQGFKKDIEYCDSRISDLKGRIN